MCALAKITKSAVQRVAETQAEEKLERVFTGTVQLAEICSQCGDAKEAETRQCEGVSPRAVQDVLFRCVYRRRSYQLKMARWVLIDSGLPKMMGGSAILLATRIRNLVVRQGEEKCPANLMRGIKPKLSISKLSFFCLHSLHKEERPSKLEPKPVDGKFVGYTEGDNG